jgi:hypothetical protein
MVRGRTARWVAITVSILALALAGRAGFASGSEVRVHVVGRGGRALVGARVFVATSGGDWVLAGRTDDAGDLVLHDTATNGSTTVAAWAGDEASWAARGSPRPPSQVVRNTNVVVALRVGVQVRTTVVDAETGSPITGATWREGRSLYPREYGPSFPNDSAQWIEVGPDGPSSFLDVSLPEARRDSYYLDEFAGGSLIALGTGDAAQAVAVVPMRRRMDLRVHFRDKAGNPAPTSALEWGFGDVPARMPRRSLAKPAADVPLSIPFYRGALVWVLGGDKERGGAYAISVSSTPPSKPFDFELRLTQFEDLDLPSTEFLGEGSETVRARGRGRVEVRVVTRDGRPMPGARVVVRPRTGRAAHDEEVVEADADGRARVEGLPVGGFEVLTADERLVRASRQVSLTDREPVASVTLTEPVGGSIEVSVVDRFGGPLPFATVLVEGALGGPGDAGIEPRRLDSFVDAHGRRTYASLEPGRAKVSASYASATGSAEVDVVGGKTTSVRLVADVVFQRK